MTVCVTSVYQPYTSWMITSTLCNPLHGWMPEFFFYAASSPQQHSRWKQSATYQNLTLYIECTAGHSCVTSTQFSSLRRLYFAQQHLRPHPSRVCLSPPGCGINSGSDVSTKGHFYTPLPVGKYAWQKSFIKKKNPNSVVLALCILNNIQCNVILPWDFSCFT